MTNQRTKVININSQQIKNKIIFTMAFKYGYYDEPEKKYGYSHLVEHYLCTFLNKKIICNDVYGSIDENYILINIDFNKKDYDNFIKEFHYNDLKKNLLSEINDQIIKKESKKLISEIKNMYLNVTNEIKEELLNKIIKKPKKISRRKNIQIKNIREIKKEEFKKSIRKILNSPKIFFIDKSSNKNNMKFRNGKFVRTCKVEFIKNKQSKINTKNFSLKDYKIICFPGLSFKSKTIERFSTRFIIYKIKKLLQENLKNEGIYDVFYDNYVYANFGLIWFMVNKVDNKKINEIFKKIPSDFLKDKNLKKEIDTFKKNQKREIKRAWSVKENRNPWIIEDLLEESNFNHPDLIINQINKISKKDIKKALKIFNVNKMYLIG